MRQRIVRVTEPEFWQQMADRLPSWADELGAILLMVLGVVTLTALFNSTSEAVLAVRLSDVLRRIFGHGAYLAALAVLASGIVLLLPKFGITVRIGWARFAAIEVVYGAFLALLHLLANDPEPRILAREGGGGGFIGWGLSYLTSSLGRPLSLAIFSALLTGGLIVLSGLRRHHVRYAISWLNERLQTSIQRLDEMSFRRAAAEEALTDTIEDWVADDVAVPALARTSPPARRQSVVPRAATPREEPMSSAPAAPVPADTPAPEEYTLSDAASSKNGKSASTEEPAPEPPPVRKLTKKEREELINQTRRTLGASNGRSLRAPGNPGDRPSVVPREFQQDARARTSTPRAKTRQIDGRIERYFTVDDFTEVKKVGKRDDNLPPLEMLSDTELNKPTEEEINTNARIIRDTLLEFEVETEVIDVKVGPTVTMYAVSPYTETVTEEGERVLNRVRVSQIANLNSDLALALSAKRLRIQAPVPGHSYVGVEVPNRKPSTVALRPVLESERFYKYRKRPLALPLGRDVSGEPFVADLQTMPHLLIAGTTGSGKSIMLASMTMAFVLNNPPERVRLVLLDPKMVELSRFNGLPHLLGPVETDLDRIIGVLRWATREMDRRYKLLEKEAARNLEIYNQLLGRRRKDEHLPYIVLIIDEIGDLMMQVPDDTERYLTRLAQMARAVGIHLMVATQRPSVDVITGLIKANFPARVSFAVASSTDSRVILDYTGAESLMGRGDMLFLAPDASGPQRVQGCYVSDEEVNAAVNYWKEWHQQRIADGELEPPGVAPWERGMTRREVLAETDPMLEDAIALVIAEGEASASMIQRRLALGYPRAARLMDLMAELGVVGAAKPGGRTREVLVKPGHDPFRKLVEDRMKNKR
ncbi:MAG: DNA translocase FtsK [Chloroflexi bacterium]|nr:DNA translocase FtsK [Chloroflexota bacterium]